MKLNKNKIYMAVGRNDSRLDKSIIVIMYSRKSGVWTKRTVAGKNKDDLLKVKSLVWVLTNKEPELVDDYYMLSYAYNASFVGGR